MFLKTSIQAGEAQQDPEDHGGDGSHAPRHARLKSHVMTVTFSAVAQKAGCTARNWSILVIMETTRSNAAGARGVFWKHRLQENLSKILPLSMIS